MDKKPPSIGEFSSLTEQSPDGYARPIEEFDPHEVSNDHVGNLDKMLEMLIQKRRYLAQEAVAFQMTFMGRSYDIAKLQPIIDMVTAARDHEKQLLASAG